jgi:hypothetical protein
MTKRKDESASERVSRLFELEAANLEAEADLEPEPEADMEPEPESDPESVPDPELEAGPDDNLYTMGSWNGKPQWKCSLCPWDTLEGEAAMLEHLATRHKPPAPRISILVADIRGNPVHGNPI